MILKMRWKTKKKSIKLTSIICICCVVSSVITFYSIEAAMQTDSYSLVEYEQTTIHEQLLDEKNQSLENQWRQHKAFVHYSTRTASNPPALEDKTQIEDDTSTSIGVTVQVWQEEEQGVTEVPLEEYVLHVALSEMPWGFQDEAIKAQIIAARTYIMHRMDNAEQVVQVSDSTKHQVYKKVDVTTLSAIEQARYKAIAVLAKQTEGMVITYEGKPIDALYFSTSNGSTEAANQYFNRDVPYLQSVESKWDASLSPSYEKQYEFTYEQFYTQLLEAGLIKKKNKKLEIQMLERTSSNRVARLAVNDTELAARQVREALGLASTDFSWRIDTDNKRITLYTLGYGHGVGMSQWGAEGMAQEGYSAIDILKHYYTNVEIESL